VALVVGSEGQGIGPAVRRRIDLLVAAIEKVLSEPKLRTRDLKGTADTVTCGKAVADALA